MNRTELKAECLREANHYRECAKRTEGFVRNANLRKAADRYRAAGLEGFARWCERFIAA